MHLVMFHKVARKDVADILEVLKLSTHVCALLERSFGKLSLKDALIDRFLDLCYE